MVSATRLDKIACGHRVVGQGGKCEHLHGHNYTLEITCESVIGTDDVGRVLDFGEIKRRVCSWLQDNWDHRFLVWDQDPWREKLSLIDPSVVWVPFNPTAENMAEHVVRFVGPSTLHGTCVFITQCIVHETDNCYATFKGGGAPAGHEPDFKVPFRVVGKTSEI